MSARVLSFKLQQNTKDWESDITVLNGVRVVEFAGLGPAPVTGMFLADMGAQVTVIDRPGGEDFGSTFAPNRGKRSICLDLKDKDDVHIAEQIVAKSDILLEGYRPGVMEKLGLGPERAHALNPNLVYTRLTGWGQTGPWANVAAHDGNYTALAGALWYGGRVGQPPFLPATLVGDIGSGSMLALSGTLAALYHAKTTGEGQVVDAAIVNGAVALSILLLQASGTVFERGVGVLEQNGPWSQIYRCADGNFVKLGAREDKFYRIQLKMLGLWDELGGIDRKDRGNWPLMQKRYEETFLSRTQDEWAEHFDGSDACVTPILNPKKASQHPHMIAREAYIQRGDRLEPGPSPTFSGTPLSNPGEIPAKDQHRSEILNELGLG